MHTDPPKRLKLGKHKQHFLGIIKKDFIFTFTKKMGKLNFHNIFNLRKFLTSFEISGC